MFSSKTNVGEVISKEVLFFFIFKEFQCSENTDKVLSVHYFSLDCPKLTKGLMVDLS